MGERIDENIDIVLNDPRMKQMLSEVGKGSVSPIKRTSQLIGEVYTFCFVHNDGSKIDTDEVISYVETMKEAYMEYLGEKNKILETRIEEIEKSIAKKFNIDISSSAVSDKDTKIMQDYFLKNYVQNGYVTHSFSGACEESIRKYGFSSTERIWDNEEIMKIAHIFEDKDVISPVGGYSHYSGGGMYVEHNPSNIYWHGLAAPEWFKWFTSSNHNIQSGKIEESPYYVRDYEACKQNVIDLCSNARLSGEETQEVMSMFENNWQNLGTERMCVALIPKSVIGKDNIEDAIIPGQSLHETIITVLNDGRNQYKEHLGNVLTQTITENDMIIMGLPNSREIFGECEFNRETRKKLYDPKLVLDMIFRGTKIAGFDLEQEKIDSILSTLREVHQNSPEVEKEIKQYQERVALFSENEVGKATVYEKLDIKKEAHRQVKSDIQELSKDNIAQSID